MLEIASSRSRARSYSAFAEKLQRTARGAKVVKAFNTQFASHMDSGTVNGQQLTTFAAGDDATAKQEGYALGLGTTIGLKLVHA